MKKPASSGAGLGFSRLAIPESGSVAVDLHFLAQSIAVDSQNLGRMHLVTTSSFQDLSNKRLFDFGHDEVVKPLRVKFTQLIQESSNFDVDEVLKGVAVDLLKGSRVEFNAGFNLERRTVWAAGNEVGFAQGFHFQQSPCLGWK